MRATATDAAGNTVSATNTVTVGFLCPWNNFDLFDSMYDINRRFQADLEARLEWMRTWFASLFNHYPWW